MKTPITGTPIREDADTIVVQEGDAVATYSKRYYRQVTERPQPAEPIALYRTAPLPIRLDGAAHLVAVPLRL